MGELIVKLFYLFYFILFYLSDSKTCVSRDMSFFKVHHVFAY